MNSATRLIILDHATMDAPIVSMSDFLAANADDADLCEQVRALKPAEGFTIGGGAAPAFSITKVAAMNMTEAYAVRVQSIREKLAELIALADDHFGLGPEDINWGHTGDLQRIERGLDVLALA